MFEGMVIDGKCLELALEPQNEKDVKFLRGKMDREFLFVAPFFGKVNHERCRENEKLQKVKRCEKVGVLQKCFWGFTLHEIRSFQLSRPFVEAHPFHQQMSSHSRARISSQFVAPAPQCLSQHC